jgi:hypothetical protein
MFDGITFSPTAAGCRFGLRLRREDPSTDYLAEKLEKAGWGSFGSFREPPVPGHGTIFSVAWDGDLSDRERILNYIRLAKGLIKNRIQQVPDRPIIVVAHSWGSVVAYQALIELEQEFNDDGRRVVPAESIAQFVTLGSPLRTQSTAIRNAIDFCFPDTPAGDQIWGTLSKPDTVSYWINAWNTADCVSGPIPSADNNVALDLPGHVIGNPPAPGTNPASCDINVNTVSSHRSYYEPTEGHSQILQMIRDNFERTCANSFASDTTVPAGYGAAFNLFSGPELVVRVICGHTGARLVAGSGKVRDLPGGGFEYPTQLVYPQAFAAIGGQWVELPLLEGDRSFGNWLVGHGSVALPFSRRESFQTRHVIAFTCALSTDNRWKCGCRDQMCATPHWQLQSFRRW